MEDNINNNIKEKNHIKELYSDKAIKLLRISIGLLIFDVLTYLLALFSYEAFDFGLIFEIASFILIVMALNNIKEDNLSSCKRNTIIAMIPIVLLMIYDFINLLANFDEVMREVVYYYTSSDQFFYYLSPYLVDVVLLTLIILLYKTYSSICRADGSKKPNNYIDIFYDKL